MSIVAYSIEKYSKTSMICWSFGELHSTGPFLSLLCNYFNLITKLNTLGKRIQNTSSVTVRLIQGISLSHIKCGHTSNFPKIQHLKNRKWLVIESKLKSSTKYQCFRQCTIATPNARDPLTYLSNTAVIKSCMF
jgi:hypothetical protein